MFRFLIVVAAFLAFCYYSFTVVEQSDGVWYRAEIGQLQKQVATLTEERDNVTTERDALKEKVEAEEKERAAADGEATKVAVASQPVEN